MIIAHNLGAMNAQRQYNIVTNKKAKTSEKLSSGYKINRAADDAAGLSISEKMRRQIRGLTQGVENTQDGVSLCQVADGALAEVNDMLHRITELSVKSANGTNSEQDRQYIQEEINQILQEIERIGDTTTFNEQKIFSGSTNTVSGGNQGGSSGVGGTGGVTNPPTTTITKERTLKVDVAGTPTDTSAQTYTISADAASGISIGTDTYDWSAIQSADGKSLADTEIAAGNYSLTHKGMTLNIQVSEGQTLDSIASKVDALSWSTSQRIVSREKAVDNLTVNTGTKIATYTNANYPLVYTVNATEEGISINGRTVRKWGEMGIDLDNLQAGTYTFNDPYANSDLSFTFEIKDGATRGGLIAGLNNVKISCSTLYEYSDCRAITFGTNIDCHLDLCMEPYHKAAVFSETVGGELGLWQNDGLHKFFEFAIKDGKLGVSYLGTGEDAVNMSKSKDYFFAITDESEQRLRTLDYSQATTEEDWKNNPIVFKNGDTELYFYLNNKGNSTITSYQELLDDCTVPFDNILMSFKHYDLAINQYAGTGKVQSLANGNVGKVTYETSLTAATLLDDKEDYTVTVPTTPTTPDQPSVDPDAPALDETIGAKRLWIQSGCEAGDGMWLEIDNMNTSILGIEDVDVSTVEGANHAMDAVKGALQKVTANRSKIGAQQNRLEHTIANEENIVENTTAAESRIRDTDMAKTMVEYSNINILLQAGQAMMAQANQSNQGVLSLLQ